tara:strand:+ start:963 stop:1364 length:402 start_codon:yes stop_codon:yes gene_type:complete
VATRSEFKQLVKEIVEEELAKIMLESSLSVYKKVLAASPPLAEDEEVYKEITEDMLPGAGGYKKRLRKKGGKLVVIKKRKKKLPLHLRKIKPSQAKRIARKSAIKRKGKQARITKKATKTTKKGRARGLYKVK